MNIFELFGTVSLKGMDKAGSQLSALDKKTQQVQKGMKIMGAAFTAVGVAGLAIISSTKELNALLGVTALSLGISTKEMRALALETTNVTFPLEEVQKSFDLLSRAGIKDQQVLKDTATAFDTLGDALGMSASQVTEVMVPAMKTFRLSAEEIAGKTDMMTYMVRNSTISMEDFNTMVGYTDQEMVDAGLTIDDMAAAMMYMSDSGVEPGKVMLREWNKAVTQSKKEGIALTEALGMTSEELERYKSGLEGATGMTQEYADVANEQYTIMDKLKQKWSELTLKSSGFLEPLEPIMAAMTALGPMMILLGSAQGTAAVKTGLHTIALITHKAALLASAIAIKIVTVAQWLWNAAMSANPIGLIILAIAALIAIGVLLYKNWDKVAEFFGAAWVRMKGVMTAAKDFFTGIWDKITGIFKKHWDKILMILFPAIGLPILIAKNWGKIMEVVTEIWDKVKSVFSRAWDTAKEWGINMVKGLWEGIKSLGSWIWDKVKGFAKGIFDSIKGGLGKLWPFSPSEAGVDIGEGLAKGIQVGIEGALGNVRSAMRDIATEMTVTGPGLGSTTPVAVGATVTNTFNIAELVVREEADIDRIARELLRKQQLRANYG